MPRVKSPLPEATDSEVLRMAAVLVDREANVLQGEDRQQRRAIGARLRLIARRVPLWPNLLKEMR